MASEGVLSHFKTFQKDILNSFSKVAERTYANYIVK